MEKLSIISPCDTGIGIEEENVLKEFVSCISQCGDWITYLFRMYDKKATLLGKPEQIFNKYFLSSDGKYQHEELIAKIDFYVSYFLLIKQYCTEFQTCEVKNAL